MYNFILIVLYRKGAWYYASKNMKIFDRFNYFRISLELFMNIQICIIA